MEAGDNHSVHGRMPSGGKPFLSFRVTRNSTPLDSPRTGVNARGSQTRKRARRGREIRTTICPFFARPVSSDSLKASTMIRIRCGVNVNLCVPQPSRILSSPRCSLTSSHTCGDDPPSFYARVRSLSRPIQNVNRDVLLGCMGEIFGIVGPSVERQCLACGQSNRTASAT